jgi:hypothetical protein
LTGHDLVERVDERRDVQCSEHASQRPGKPDLGEERDTSSGVARNRCAVPEHEPPAVVPRFIVDGCEEAAGLSIGERQQSQLFASVEPGDDTRRPAAELSGAGIEQNRTREPRDRHVVGLRVSSHLRSVRGERRAALSAPVTLCIGHELH